MADFQIPEEPSYTDKLRMFETTDPGHADLFNAVMQVLIENDAFLKKVTDALKTDKADNTSMTGAWKAYALNTNGWLRVARINTYGTSTSCTVSIKRTFAHAGNECHKFEVIGIHGEFHIKSIYDISSVKEIDKIRVVLASNYAAYIDMHVTGIGSETNENAVVTIEDAVSSYCELWNMLDGQIVPETTSGETVLAELEFEANSWLPDVVNKDGDAVSGNLSVTQALGKDCFLAYPKGGVNNFASSVTGFLKIKLPAGFVNTMLKFVVSIYNYVYQTSCDYHISGYVYDVGNIWHQVSAYCIGGNNSVMGELPVAFGSIGNDPVISIGESDTVWNYASVVVHDVLLGYSNYGFERWTAAPFEISIDTTPIGNVTSTVKYTGMPCISVNNAPNIGKGGLYFLQTSVGSEDDLSIPIKLIPQQGLWWHVMRLQHGGYSSNGYWVDFALPFDISYRPKLRGNRNGVVSDWRDLLYADEAVQLVKNAGAKFMFGNIINLGAYAQDVWYPCTTVLAGAGVYKRINVHYSLGGTRPSWGEHQSGFSCNLDVLTKASGWGTTNGSTIMLDWFWRFVTDNKPPCAYTQMTESSTAVLWLRGGGVYYIDTDFDCQWVVHQETYTVGGESVTPTDQAPSVIYGGGGKIYSDLGGTADNAIGLTTFASALTTNESAVAKNYIGYVMQSGLPFGQGDGALYKQRHSEPWEHQIYGDYRSGQIAVRGKSNGSLSAWRTILDSVNYADYIQSNVEITIPASDFMSVQKRKIEFCKVGKLVCMSIYFSFDAYRGSSNLVKLCDIPIKYKPKFDIYDSLYNNAPFSVELRINYGTDTSNGSVELYAKDSTYPMPTTIRKTYTWICA